MIISGDGIPSIPRWGLTGKADEFWNANDFEILGACYRREVENFLAYLNDHHEFQPSKKETKIKPGIAPLGTTVESLGENSPGATPLITGTVLAPGEDSISRFQRSSAVNYTFRTPGIFNSSVFGHPAQNTSSKAFQELFGVKNSKNRTGHVVVNSPSPATPVAQSNKNSSGEAPGPGDSDGDDSDDGKGNKPPHNPRIPQQGKNPFENAAKETIIVTSGKTSVEPQFDTKLKMDAIPTWDGSPDSLRRWFLKLNSLSRRSEIIFKQLGTLVPTRLTGNAETWYYSQSVETRERIEDNWGTLRAAIGEYYMNRAFLDKQKA